MSELVEYARRELTRLGMDPNDTGDMNGKMAQSIVEVVEKFSEQGHSGFSAGYASNLLEKLLRFEPISPLTGEADEWMEVGEGVWQNIRCFHVFKETGGRAYDIDGRIFREPDGSTFTSAGSRVYITFPYTPRREYVDVDAHGNPINTPAIKKLEAVWDHIGIYEGALAPASAREHRNQLNEALLPLLEITGATSDGYHTFDELYEHRMALTAALTAALPRNLSWRSKAHHPDGEPMFEGFFIVGIDLPTGTITYHYKLEHWKLFSHVRIIPHAPAWDGHTPTDVVNRLKAFVLESPSEDSVLGRP